MELVNVRMEVSKVTSANVSYLSKRLGISKKKTYALIVDFFLYERDLATVYIKLTQYLALVEKPDPAPDDDGVPF